MSKISEILNSIIQYGNQQPVPHSRPLPLKDIVRPIRQANDSFQLHHLLSTTLFDKKKQFKGYPTSESITALIKRCDHLSLINDLPTLLDLITSIPLYNDSYNYAAFILAAGRHGQLDLVKQAFEKAKQALEISKASKKAYQIIYHNSIYAAANNNEMALALTWSEQASQYDNFAFNYNVIIDACARYNKPGLALKLFNTLDKMKQVNAYSYCSLIGFMGKIHEIEVVQLLEQEAFEKELVNGPIYCTLINFYGKNGFIEKAESLLQDVEKNTKQPNISRSNMIYIYGSLIDSYILLKKILHAKKLFNKTPKIKPNNQNTYDFHNLSYGTAYLMLDRLISMQKKSQGQIIVITGKGLNSTNTIDGMPPVKKGVLDYIEQCKTNYLKLLENDNDGRMILHYTKNQSTFFKPQSNISLNDKPKKKPPSPK